MSKKQRSSRQKNQATLSVAELQQQAEAALAQQRYKEAIDSYKQLLKHQVTAPWQAALAQAYLGRGHELARKGMFKEAAVMWENRATSCADQSLRGLYLEWLLKGERYANAALIYQKHLPELEQEAHHKQLAALFGALLLSTQSEVLQKNLSAIPRWDNYIQAAQALLEAYCSGLIGAALDSHLNAISLRSPFRDLRILIKALVSLETDQASALEWAEKIPPDSPYFGLAQLLPNPALELLDNVDELPRPLPKQDAFVASLYGWDKKQQLVFQNLLKNQERNLFEFVLKQHQGLGTAYVQQLCKQWAPLLPSSYINTYRSYFPLNDFEYNCVSALRIEKTDIEYAIDIWDDALDALHDMQTEEATRHKAALIQKRRILLLRKSGFDNLINLEKPLQNCIDWNPNDKTAWLELIALYKEKDDKQNYYNQVNEALTQFPKDVDVLLSAVAAAQHRQAFKKAAGYAQDILRVDPINSQARRALIESHLGHARKQLKQEKYHLVSKELESALQYERGEVHIALHINQALLDYQLGKSNSALEELQLTTQHAHSLLGGYAVIFLECKQANINPELLIQCYKKKPPKPPLLPAWNKGYVPSAEELLCLPKLLSPYKADSNLKSFLREWQTLLQKAARQSLKIEQLLVLCDFFKQMELYRLLQSYAEVGLKKSPQHTTFTFYAIYAKTDADIFSISSSDYERLRRALDNAHDADDHRTAVLILNFFKQKEQKMVEDIDSSILDMSNEGMHKIKDLFEGDPDKILEIVFDGRVPSQKEIDELGPDGLMLRLLQKINLIPEDEGDDRGSKLDGLFDEDEEDDYGGKVPPSRRKKTAKSRKKGK